MLHPWGMPRFLIALVLLLALLVGGDIFLRSVTENRAADQIQASLDLDETPDVNLGGWPFVFKALGGNFPSVSISVEDARIQGVRLEDVTLDLRNVRFRLADLLAGDERAVETGGGTGAASIDSRGVSRALRRQGVDVEVSLNGDGSVTVRDERLPEAVAGEMTLEEGAVVIVADGLPQRLRFFLPELIDGLTYESLEVSAGVAELGFSFPSGTLRAPR